MRDGRDVAIREICGVLTSFTGSRSIQFRFDVPPSSDEAFSVLRGPCVRLGDCRCGVFGSVEANRALSGVRIGLDANCVDDGVRMRRA